MVKSALATLGVASSEAAMIGDSEVDVATAHAADLAIVLLGHGYVRGKLAEASADAIADGFAALTAALESLGFRIGG